MASISNAPEKMLAGGGPHLGKAQAAEAVGKGSRVGLVAVWQQGERHDGCLDGLRRRHQQLAQPRYAQRHVRLPAPCQMPDASQNAAQTSHKFSIESHQSSVAFFRPIPEGA